VGPNMVERAITPIKTIDHDWIESWRSADKYP
jgi:hypothetical protein